MFFSSLSQLLHWNSSPQHWARYRPPLHGDISPWGDACWLAPKVCIPPTVFHILFWSFCEYNCQSWSYMKTHVLLEYRCLSRNLNRGFQCTWCCTVLVSLKYSLHDLYSPHFPFRDAKIAVSERVKSGFTGEQLWLNINEPTEKDKGKYTMDIFDGKDGLKRNFELTGKGE